VRGRTIYRIVVSYLKMSFRDKTVLFWSVMFPLLLLTFIVFLFAPKPVGEQATVKTVSVMVVPARQTSDLIELAKEYVKYMNLTEFNGQKVFIAEVANVALDVAVEMLRNGSCDVVLYLPEDAVDEMRNFTVVAKVYVLTGTPNIVEEQMNEMLIVNFLHQTGMYLIHGVVDYAVTPIISNSSKIIRVEPRLAESIGILRVVKEVMWNNTKVEVVRVKPKGAEEGDIRPYVIGWMTVSVIFMQYMFSGILGGASSTSRMFEKRYLERIFSTRVSPMEIFVGLLISWIASLTVPTMVCLAWGILVLGAKFTITPLSPEFPVVVLLVLIGAILSISIGLLVGLLVRSTEAASVVANLIVWPSMMLGGFWLPRFMLPEFARVISEIHPLSMLLYSTVDIALYKRPLTAILVPAVTATVVTVVALTLSSILYRRRVTKYLER